MDDIIPGTRLGRYEVRSKLGAGGMADVYLAEDTDLGRKVALKLLPPATAADDHARKRLVREARAAATLDHPHICAIYEVGEAEGRLFFAMQYVEGDTLAARMRRQPLSLSETLAIAVQIVDALAEAHGHGILHRDIKPGNIMLTARGQARMMDFGLAKVTAIDERAGNTETDLLSTPGAVMGTMPYMSPEQVRGEGLDARADLFSIGVVLYEMLTGRRPFDDSSSAAIASAILTREPLPLARFAPETPAELERIVGKLLRKAPDDRYQTARDLLNDLRTLKDEREFRARLERSGPSSDPAVTGDSAGPAGALPATPPPFAVTPTPGPMTPAPVPGSLTTTVVERAPRGRMVAVAVMVAAVLAGGWFGWRAYAASRARAALPQIAALAEAGRFFEAYDLAASIETALPGDATLAGLMPTISDTLSATTDPPGASVYLTRFRPESDAPPVRLQIGTTPLTNVRIARGAYILAIEKEGFAPFERTVSGLAVRNSALSITPPPIRIDRKLVAATEAPEGMVFVPGGEYRLAAWSRPTDRRVRLEDYFIDRYEASNADYKAFINAGGYVKRDYWPASFADGEQRLTWDDAMRRLVDRTGLAGPRGWSNQTVPEGKADHPVTGITWYEAAAYAAFRGKALPSVYQWEKAARNGVTGPAGVAVMPWGFFAPGDTLDDRANFGGATLPVTSGAFGLSPFGAYNMAGNVSEWTANDSSDGLLATGGAWGDPTYTFAQYGGRPPFFSSDRLGVRLVRDAPGAGDQGRARIEIASEIPQYAPTSASRFAELSAAYDYAPTPLESRVEETLETPEWRRERVSFNGANGERATAFLYLPLHASGPVQVVHFVPAGDVDGGFRSLTASTEDRIVSLVKAGRAVFGVLLKGYIGRPHPEGTVPLSPGTVEYQERIVSRVTDLRRGLDYLDTRKDIDASRIGFVGPSAGAQLGLILSAVETRYRAVIMVGAGLPLRPVEFIAAANPANFASHIRPPKLILQGRFDEDTPLRTAAEPRYRLLAAPKRLILYDGGHVPPLDLQVTTITGFFDEIMGRVAR
jgi:formylglycine-generating enzyme required for sulfatase activity/dienelactone hydrolase